MIFTVGKGMEVGKKTVVLINNFQIEFGLRRNCMRNNKVFIMKFLLRLRKL